MNVLKVTAAVWGVTLVLAGCSTELILERDSGEAPAPAQTTEVPQPPTNEELSGGESDPDPVAISYGVCLDVDFSGTSVRFNATVSCEDVHDAEVYESTVMQDESVPAIRQWCHGELPNSLQDDTRGKAYALESPAGYVHNQGVAVNGDEVFCVYVHAEPREGAFAEPRSEDDGDAEEDSDS